MTLTRHDVRLLGMLVWWNRAHHTYSSLSVVLISSCRIGGLSGSGVLVNLKGVLATWCRWVLASRWVLCRVLYWCRVAGCWDWSGDLLYCAVGRGWTLGFSCGHFWSVNIWIYCPFCITQYKAIIKKRVTNKDTHLLIKLKPTRCWSSPGGWFYWILVGWRMDWPIILQDLFTGRRVGRHLRLSLTFTSLTSRVTIG